MSWDVDGNGSLDALTDGRLVLSYLFGFTGEALIRNSLAPDATRTQAAEIIACLESIRDQLDVDGNGEIDALTDAILYLRYLFGFTGEALTSGAVGAGATRANASQIIGYLESITDDGGNQAPIAVDDLAFTQESSSVTIAVLDNDLDPDGDAIAIAGVSTPAAGTISIDGDELEYSPADGFTGTDSFSYTIDDGQLTDTATVTVTVEGANAPPGAADDLAFTQVNSPVTIFVLDNDFPDGFVGLVDFDSSSAVGGRIARDNNDSPFDTTDDFLIYTPAFGFIGTDSFTYTISDGNGDTDTAEVTVTVSDSVTPSNNDNFANAQEISGVPTTSTSQNILATLEEGEPNHAGNAGGSSVWWSWTAPENGSVTITTGGSDFDTVLGVYTGNSLSSLTEIASNDDSGEGLTSSVTFNAVAGEDYKIAVDGFGGAIGNINLNIESASASNNSPIAVDDLAFTQVNSSVTIAVLDNDFPDGEVELVGFGSFSVEDGTIALNNNDSPFDPTDDFLIYTPAFDFVGVDSFSYTITDAQGLTDTATVNVTVESSPNNSGNTQIITPVPSTQLASVNEAISIDVQYSTDPANSPTAGIAFRLHWDSTKLSFDGVDNILADDFISEGLPVEDTDNSDNDPTTDRLISVSWVDLLGGSWPNNPSSLPISLYTANFTTASDFADSTTVNFSLGSGSTSAGFDFSSTSATIGFG